MTGIKLELLTDLDMLLYFEQAIRCGISHCCNRYACANNAYMNSYDPNKVDTFLMYFDACNLHSVLPYRGFKWLTPEEINIVDIHAVPYYGMYRYVLEVDLEYPQSTHDLHTNLPMRAESKTPEGL